MLNIIINSWVKYVNNWRLIVSISIGYISTFISLKLAQYIYNLVKTHFIPQLSPIFSNTLSTPKMTDFHLLSKSFTHNPHNLLLVTNKKI